MTTTIRHTITTLLIALTGTILTPPAVAPAAEAPVKEVISSHLGWEVDTITKGDICTIASQHECQPGKPSSQTGGFEYPESPAGAPNGNIYIVDHGNRRVQELTATGQFVLMFGWDVNKTKIKEAEKGATITQTEKNHCTAGEECQTGVEGPAPGQFGEAMSGMAVDPVSGDVYVADRVRQTSAGGFGDGERVQKFTGEGGFILEIGKEVNETKTNIVKAKGGTPTQKELEEENLCTHEGETKKVKCAGPGSSPPVTLKAEPGVFGEETVIAVGGLEDRLYVGERLRVQEFNPGGKAVSEPAEKISARLIQISSYPDTRVAAIAIDNSCALHEPVLNESTIPTCKEFDLSYGDVYLTYHSNAGGSAPNVIRRFDVSGKETEFPVSAVQIVVDKAGRLAVLEGTRGVLYQAGAVGLHLITEFAMPSYPYLPSGMAFNGSDDLFVTSLQPGHEVTVYNPVPVGEVASGTVVCEEGAGLETFATFNCGLKGEVNPWGVPGTEVSFQWGRTIALGSETPKQVVCTTVCGSTAVPVTPALVEGLQPNETFFFQVAGHDANVQAPELLTSEKRSFLTPTVSPRIVGESSVSYVHFSSAVLSGEVNPENASTVYGFQYGACKTGLEGCAEVGVTEALVSNAYGVIATTLQATGLQPSTTYHYRLLAVNEHEQVGVGPEATFTTARAPVPQAQTGSASMITATSAVVSGSVNPNGQQAVYTFELGIDKGSSTRFGIVLSAPAGSSSTPVEKTVALSGLAAGTTYAYRITVKNGFVRETVDGVTLTFTTEGLPAVLPSPLALGLLPVPSIGFPKPASTPKAKPKKTKSKNKKKTKSKAKGKKAKKGAAKKSDAHTRNPHKSKK
jgi:hypothetical protein